MSHPHAVEVPDPAIDLVFERLVPIPPERCFAAWTEPALLTRWFTPAPWKTLECEVDLRPGGLFRSLMQGPDGERHENVGVFLEIARPGRLVWSNAFAPGWRPQAVDGKPGFLFACILSFAPEAGGTRYRALVRHADAAGRDRHEAMGFQEGWGRALDQLLAL